MKIENVFSQDDIVQYTRAMTNSHANASFEVFLADNSVSSIASNAQSTDTLLLLLQGMDTYNGYVDAIIEHDVLTEAERQYLLTGELAQIEKKNMPLL